MDYKRKVAEVIREQIDINLHNIEELIEIPPSIEMGDYAFPCFQLAKVFRKDPNIIAEELNKKLRKDGFEKIRNLGPYVNFFIDKSEFKKEILEKILLGGNNYGKSNIGNGKTICIECSSPNIGDYFNVGHLVSAVIGNCLYKLFNIGGYKVELINHLGDWGSRFDKIIYAYKRWGNDKALVEDVTTELLRVYHKFREDGKSYSLLEKEKRLYFKELENNNENTEGLMEKVKDLTLREFERIYGIFNINFNSYISKSFYDDRIDSLINKLKEKIILFESNGTQIIMLNEYNMPPCVILEENNRVKYETIDLVATIYKKNTYNFDKCIYVFGASETLYFKKIFKALELLGYQWVSDCIHVRFGLFKFQDRSYFARVGEVHLLDDLIDKAIEKSLEIINEKNLSLVNKEEAAKKIAIGALIFTCLNSPREKDIVFNLNEAISFEGETSPYIQYVYLIAKNILKNAKELDVNPNFRKLNSKEESDLVRVLEGFNKVISESTEKLEPCIIAKYTIKLVNTFSKFYNSHPILSLEDEELMKARLILVEATCQIIKNSLDLMGIEVVENI